MVHNPCGPMNKNAVCMKDGKCSKNYPKQFCLKTSEIGGYPSYRRRSPEQGGATEPRYKTVGDEILEWTLDNTHIVPYNPTLLLHFDSHINVEVASSVVAVKYLYKYVYKGHDRVMFSVGKKKSEESKQRYQIHVLYAYVFFLCCSDQKDEIQEFTDARYVSAPEASWRIFDFDIQQRYPSVTRLVVHMPDLQQVYYKGSDTTEVVQAKMEASTKYVQMFFYILDF